MHGAHLGEVPLDGAGLAALDLQEVVHVGRRLAIDVDLVHQHALEALHSITVFLKFCCENTGGDADLSRRRSPAAHEALNVAVCRCKWLPAALGAGAAERPATHESTHTHV